MDGEEQPSSTPLQRGQETLMAGGSQEGEPQDSESEQLLIPVNFPGPTAESSREN